MNETKRDDCGTLNCANLREKNKCERIFYTHTLNEINGFLRMRNSTESTKKKLYMNSLANNEKQSHCIYHKHQTKLVTFTHTHTHTYTHEETTTLTLVANVCLAKKKQNKKNQTAWITPTNEANKKILSNRITSAVSKENLKGSKKSNNV